MKYFKLLIVILFITMQSCTGQTQKINGISFVASRDSINETHITPIVNMNANYVAIIPLGFIRDLKSPEIAYDTGRQWFGETKAGVKQSIEEFKKKKIKIMLKPQIWIRRGEFTGYLKMDNEVDWKVLEDSYATFILDFAQLAQDTKAELFCIGTELEQFVTNRPEYWNNLIVEIKKIYKGKLTYAANWDEFKRTPFWSDIDYIGIDAYFPVSDEKTPTVATCLVGWQKHKKVIKNLSEKHEKPVLFTEFGYRSVDYAGKEPWKSDRSMTVVNLNAQTNTTHALFEIFWNEKWFSGGFIWKWHSNYEHVGGEENTQFTPQNKPVEQTIKQYYSQ